MPNFMTNEEYQQYLDQQVSQQRCASVDYTDLTEKKENSHTLGQAFYTDLEHSLNLKTSMGKAALKLALSNIQLLDRKQQDYGSGNINRHGAKGVLVRIDDKSARLSNLIAKPDIAPNNEPLLDSWKDISNYAIIGQLLATNEWK